MLKYLVTTVLGLAQQVHAGEDTKDNAARHNSDASLLDEQLRHRLDGDVSNDITLEAFDNKMTVHLVHHSHDDVGWLKTVDEYYSGINNSIQRAEVELIIDETMEALINDEKKRYSQVEMKFFSMWWDRQTDELRDKVRVLVNEGRLELLNAGWSMHDEACPHFEDFINNMRAGHEFVQK